MHYHCQLRLHEHKANLMKKKQIKHKESRKNTYECILMFESI